MVNNRILLFIPMYNCEKQIVRVLNQLTSTEIQSCISEVLVVNNRSTDNGEEAVINYCEEHRLPPIKLLRNDQNYGLGGSHKVAFNYAIENHFDYVIILHGDDQGNIQDIMPLLQSREFENYDCCLGARFMKGAKLSEYSKPRIFGNYIFNLLFSLTVHSSIKDLGSGLNLYKVSTLSSKYFMQYPDTLYFNDLMILASCFYKHKMLFFPISWREEDQVSNNKLISFSISLMKMLFHYIKDPKQYLNQDMRNKKIENYSAQIVWSN